MDTSEEAIAEVFKRMGAADSQAKTMAGQLIKRARQLAKSRTISEKEALEELLSASIRGREGVYEPKSPQNGGL